MSLVPYSAGLRLYERLPPSLKSAMGAVMSPVPRSLLLGGGFRRRLEGLMESERRSREELERIQLRQLRLVLEHAERNVPYYHDVFKAVGLRSQEVKDLGALRRLPVLTKDIIRKEGERMIASDQASYRPGKASTTGSTGRPLSFLLDQQTREVELAAVWRHYLGCGASGLDARIASFRGDFVSERERGALWRWDGRVGELTFNTYALGRDNIRKIIGRLNRFRPEIVRGYPHSLYVLSRGMEAAGARMEASPRFVHTSSEQLPGSMREAIESAMGCPVRDWYSQSEYVISAGECSEGRYHQNMETGAIGLLEDDWGMERLIGTSLCNRSMPFINYDIGDHVTLGGECPCGREHVTFRAIEGRVNDMIITAGGRAVSGVGVDNFYEKEVIPFLAVPPEFLMLVQEDALKFTIEVYSSAGLEDAEADRIRRSFAELLGEGSDITIKLLESMPDRKKWKNVESRLSAEAIARLIQEHNS
jgi:phenylacetate-CoA ligase